MFNGFISKMAPGAGLEPACERGKHWKTRRKRGTVPLRHTPEKWAFRPGWSTHCTPDVKCAGVDGVVCCG